MHRMQGTDLMTQWLLDLIHDEVVGESRWDYEDSAPVAGRFDRAGDTVMMVVFGLATMKPGNPFSWKLFRGTTGWTMHLAPSTEQAPLEGSLDAALESVGLWGFCQSPLLGA